MDLSTLGLFVQMAGVGLLAIIFLYISRESRSRVLHAMGYGWLFLFLALLAQATLTNIQVPFGNFPYQYLKILYFVTLVVAADRMSHDSSLGRPLRIAALISVAVSFGIVFFAGSRSVFYAIHMALGAVAWLLVAGLVVRSRVGGLGKPLAALLALLTGLLNAAYAVLFTILATHNDQPFRFLAYTGFYDLFLEMAFGMALIIWAMEDTERKLSSVHARTVDDTQRTRRKAQLDPLTETYNRLFLDENRESLSRNPAGGTIVLIDVDELKTINDREGHEEGDKAIWTVATAIKKLIRGDDYVVRWGGDEFLVVLPGMEQDVITKRFYLLPAKIEEVRNSPRHSARCYRKFLSASVGVTPYSKRIPFDSAVEMADRMMYERKKAHRRVREDKQKRQRPGEHTDGAWNKPN